MIIGIGIDIVEVERIARAAAKEGFLQRAFTDAEREAFAAVHNAPERIAGCFCAKEAVMKALGAGLVLRLNEIEILHEQSGQPYAVLHNEAKRRMESLGGRALHVSVSHLSAMAAAEAILEG